MALVLLFNTAAKAELAARIHEDTCPMVNTAKRPAVSGVVRRTDVTQEVIDDLNEREWPVKACKCVKDLGALRLK